MTRIHPRTLLALAVAAGLATASAASAVTLLDWSAVTWNPGDLTRTYTFGPPENVDVTITVSTTAAGPGPAGTFTNYDGVSITPPCGLATPNKDGAPSPATYPSDRFGTKLDLGVVFDPGANSNQSVLIAIKFTDAGSGAGGPLKPVATFKFEISDIDWSGGGNDCFQPVIQGWRRDQVVITAANSATPVTAFTLTPLVATSPPRTFLISPFNTATAVGDASSGLQSNTDDNGSLVVDFGSSLVTDVLITYNEAAFNDVGPVFNTNPGFRGIAILGVAMFPVGLTEFTIE